MSTRESIQLILVQVLFLSLFLELITFMLGIERTEMFLPQITL